MLANNAKTSDLMINEIKLTHNEASKHDWIMDILYPIYSCDGLLPINQWYTYLIKLVAVA